ncbi:ELM1/GtrOC1 family putative glycosyltransferase [Pseudovibrio ascidiaceicola]|uniref:ELM1/GtrOC1 family putative glycosyltransferase n=1 Tax=Pseudovibrio ascidiaceicola TaxID=285279 RepID=UPI003D36E84F
MGPKQRLPKDDVDGAFVISTLGAGELPAVYLSKLGAFSIHLGELKRIPYNLIDMTIAHPGHVTKVDEFKLPYAPSSIDDKKLLPKAERNDLLVAFGGDTGSLTYSRNFYEKTLSLAAIVAERNHLALKITTSHRTGLKNEEVIQEYIQGKNLKVEQLALYNQDDVPSMGSLLTNAAVALISAESVSMISEALAASAKTVAIYEQALPKEERISRFLEEQLCNNQLMLIDAISTGDIKLASLQFPSVSWKTPFLSAVHRKLNKKNIRAAA